jgi:two-component system sensor histidine kinase CpxA
MRLFIRMLVICWSMMLLLSSLVMFFPASTWPFQEDSLFALPLRTLESCSDRALEKYRAQGSLVVATQSKECGNGHLITVAALADPNRTGESLSRDEINLARRAAGGDTVVETHLASGTVIAFRADPKDTNSPIYLATVPSSMRIYIDEALGHAGKAVFLTGFLSLLAAAYFMRPITRLSAVAETFGSGDLKARIGPSLTGRKDQLGDLGRTFNGMAERIESLVSDYKSFLAHASHELGSPLTRLNIALALARSKAGPALEPEHERIGREADRLNDLVQEMLLLARLESGNELGKTPELFDIASVVEEAFENATFESQQMNKSLTITRLESLFASGHPDLLLRAIDNVLRNGLRFAKTKVLVRARTALIGASPACMIVIEDDGPGIPEGSEDLIFRPFFTVNDTASSEIARGAGLGLAIARHAAIACGGTISAHRSEIGGLAVAIALPIQPKTS